MDLGEQVTAFGSVGICPQTIWEATGEGYKQGARPPQATRLTHKAMAGAQTELQERSGVISEGIGGFGFVRNGQFSGEIWGGALTTG